MLGTRVKKPFFFIIFIFCCICLFNKVFAIPYDFAVIGDETAVPEVKNIYQMFSETGISYKKLLPSQITSDTVFSDVNAIISFIRSGSTISNPTAVINFANNHIVLSDGYDFANYYYRSSLLGYYGIARASYSYYPVTYLIDWGNFRTNDKTEMYRPDTRSLGVFLTSRLDSVFPSSHTKIVKYNNTHTAFFHVGTGQNGFYVMDLSATTNETEWPGIWHIFPVVKMVKNFPTGKYSRWMGNGVDWWDLTWINNTIATLVNENSDIASRMVIGQSVQGRNINAIVIGKGNRYAIIDGCIHGNEKTGAFAALRVAELLIEYYRHIPSWQTKLNQYKIIIIPVLNPDGFVANIRENAHGKDLNRQFPPGGTTTEPETWALRNLIDDYKPIIYVNYHVGGCLYRKDVLWGAYQPESFKEFTRYSLKIFTSNEYNSLKHWLWYPNCTGYLFSAASASVYSSGYDSMAVQYASQSQNTSSLIIESLAGSSIKSLWALDFYPSLTIGQLKHYDYNGNYLLISNGFISGTSATADTLTISLNTSELTSSSKSVIKDMRNRGRPIEVFIDGVKKNEGYGWSYNSGTKNITVTGAINSISLNWGTSSISTTTSTTRPTTIITSTTSTRPSTSTIISTISTTMTTTIFPTSDLVSYWKFDDCTAKDSSGTGNDGTIYGATCVDGKIGKALSFDGSNVYVDVGNTNILNPTEAMSIGVWINTRSITTYPRIISKETGIIADPYALELINSTDIKFFIGNGTTETGTPDINVNLLNTWVHVVGTYDGQYIKIYINGQLKGQTAKTGLMLSRTTNVFIGNNPTNARQFNGTIDEVKIWNRALTADEVRREYGVPSEFTTANFICNYVQTSNLWECSLDYTNNLNEKFLVKFYFIDSVSSEVKSTGSIWANIGSGTVGSEISCNNYHGTYNVIWRAYPESDRINSIAWSISPQTITCP